MFINFVFQKTIKNIKRLKSEINTRERKFIIRNVFLNMLFFLFQNIRNETICHAIFCLIFAIFLRIEKFIYTQTNFENFEFNFWNVIRFFVELFENKLKLTFFVSKMNSFRQKIIFHIVVIYDEICFLISLKRLYLQYFSEFDEFFFQARTNQFFIVKYVINVFRNKFKNLNIVDHYSKHFFRRNVVTSTR